MSGYRAAMLHQVLPFVLAAPNGILSGRLKGEEALNQVVEHLRSEPFDSVLPLDFRLVDFIDISCADEFLARLLMRVGSGEMGTRFVFIQKASASVRETLDAVLKLRGLSALIKERDEVFVIGVLKRPMKEALEVLIRRKHATSSDLAEALNKNVNVVCNRLNALQRMRLICRVSEGSVPGGGRQFHYESIV